MSTEYVAAYDLALNAADFLASWLLHAIGYSHVDSQACTSVRYPYIRPSLLILYYHQVARHSTM